MNKAKLCTAGLAVMLHVCAVFAEPGAQIQDIEITVRHVNGTVEIFGKEVASMDVIVAPDGHVVQVHLILVSGTEKDTHLWLNYANLASLRYRFLQITGKGKVHIKQLRSYDVQQNPGEKSKVSTVEPDDFK